MIYTIVGELGSGKTLFLTCLAILHHLKGEQIYSNYSLHFPHTRLTSTKDIQTKKQGAIFLDESSQICDSHNWRNPEMENFYDFIARSRKRRINLYLTAQHFYRLGKDLRNLTNEIYLPHIIYKISHSDPPKFTARQEDERPKVPWGIISSVANKGGFLIPNKKIHMDCSTPIPELNNRPPYELYDTHEELDKFETISGGILE